MKVQTIPKDYQHLSPAGAEVRPLMENSQGGVAHCTLRAGKISKAVAHKTVSEIWHVISGSGEIWRKQGTTELITHLEGGVTIDIPQGAEFQYKSSPTHDLIFICVTMPPWPGPDEIRFVNRGAWIPTH